VRVAASGEWTYDGREYRLLLASDVDRRDGLGLELYDTGAPEPLMEIFRDDVTGRVTLTAFGSEPLPLALVERFMDVARDRLGARH
jgi:hypothetical protein